MQLARVPHVRVVRWLVGRVQRHMRVRGRAEEAGAVSRGRAVRRFRVPRRLAGRARRAPDRRDSGHQAGASVRRASRGRKGRARCDVPRVQRVHGTTGIHRAVRADAVHVPPLGRRAVVGVRRQVRGRRQNKARLLQPAGRFVGGDDRVVLRAGRRASPPVAAAAGAASTPVHGDVQPLFAAAAAAACAAARRPRRRHRAGRATRPTRRRRPRPGQRRDRWWQTRCARAMRPS